MVRLVKRYGGGSRKLYDTEEARYVSLEEVGQWVRGGQRLRVVDAKSGEDVTSSTLAQVIFEEERRGVSLLPSELFHEILRRGERVLSRRVEQIQHGVEQLVEHVRPIQEARREMDTLRQRLEQLETSLAELEASRGRGRSGSRRRKGRGKR